MRIVTSVQHAGTDRLARRSAVRRRRRFGGRRARVDFDAGPRFENSQAVDLDDRVDVDSGQGGAGQGGAVFEDDLRYDSGGELDAVDDAFGKLRRLLVLFVDVQRHEVDL